MGVQAEFNFKMPPIWPCMHTCTAPHKGSCSGVIQAGVKTQRRGGRMTSQHPAEQQVPWSWTVFKHTHKDTHIHTYICVCTHSPPPPPHHPPLSCSRLRHTCTQTHISSPEILLVVLRRHRRCYVFDFQLPMGVREGLLSQWLARIWARSDRIWGLSLHIII